MHRRTSRPALLGIEADAGEAGAERRRLAPVYIHRSAFLIELVFFGSRNY
jgi:hypothetical protein